LGVVVSARSCTVEDAEGDEASGTSPGLFAFKEARMAMVEDERYTDRAKTDPTKRQAVLERVEKETVRFIHLWFTDLEGHLKSFAITPAELEDALDDGMGFDGSSITGFNPIEESDMVAIPDPATFQLMPNGDITVARMICDVVTPDGEPYEGDPRYVLKRALERMKTMGFETFNVGPELEYFLFKDDRGTETLDEGGYFAMTALDAAWELRNETITALESMGIPIEYVHHEVGPSQHEIDMRFASALDMADHTITYRLVVKELAKKAGCHATFMPKPLFGENGSGMHTHQSLFADGKNAFFDADDEWHLSDVGKAFIAGQLQHAREIAAVFAQWVNSYKRLVPGYEAPVYVAWSRRNRSALIRIPVYKPGHEQATRAEIRCPDPACNPYLTFAALLHAGLEGIEKGYELPPPMEQNLYHLTAEQRRERGIVALPETLGEAIDELATSELARRALGQHIFDAYVEIKRKEWDEYRVQLTAWEMEKYLSVL
jgi:glutamine synthetase